MISIESFAKSVVSYSSSDASSDDDSSGEDESYENNDDLVCNFTACDTFRY